MRCTRTSTSWMPSFSSRSLASSMNSPVICWRSEVTISLSVRPRDGVLDAVLDGVAHQRFGAAFVAAAGRLVELRGVEDAPLDVVVDGEALALAGQELLAVELAREHAAVEFDHVGRRTES